MVEKLKAGKKISMQPKQTVKGEVDLYQQQRKDFKEISKETGMNIVRVNRINGNESYFVADNFVRHAIPEKVSGNLDGKDRVALIKAVCSGEVLLASDLIKGVRCGVSSMSILARKHSFDIYTIFTGRHVEGWVLIEDGATERLAKAKNSEISDLGDMLDALDYLKVEKEVAARMPDSTPDEILEAAYREFKRVAKDASSTINEVLAVKDSQ